MLFWLFVAVLFLLVMRADAVFCKYSTEHFNTLVLLSVAITESGDSSSVVNNKGSNNKNIIYEFNRSIYVHVCY